MMSMFLNPEDLIRLTGYKSSKKQAERLMIMRIPYETNAYGEVIVHTEALLRHFNLFGNNTEMLKKDGKRVWQSLGHNYHAAISEYNRLESNGASHAPDTMNALFDKFVQDFLDDEHNGLSPKTIKEYHKGLPNLRRTFGAVPVKKMHSGLVGTYLRKRGGKHPFAANREISLLSNVFQFAFSEGLAEPLNPCYGIKRKKEPPRVRELTDEELNILFEGARRHSNMMWCILMFAYATALRKSDILRTRKLSKSDADLYENFEESNLVKFRSIFEKDIESTQVYVDLDSGESGYLYVKHAKTGIRHKYRLTTNLRKIIEMATLIGNQESPWLFQRRDGHRYTADGFSSIFYRMVHGIRNKNQDMPIGGLSLEDVRFHDLRLKSASDAYEVGKVDAYIQSLLVLSGH